MRDTQEIWKPIEEVNGIYSVSNMGRVKNNRSGLILKPIKMPKGYTKVNLKINGKSKNKQVHRLVAVAFIPNPKNKTEVNHINGIHDDNRLCNLEWVTGEENRKHAYDTCLVPHKDLRRSGYLYRLWHTRNGRIYKWSEEWDDFLTFRQWCLDNGYKEGMFVSLKEGCAEYSPKNCVITNSLKRRPKRRELMAKYMCFGEELTTMEICQKYNIQEETFKYRLKKGMPVEKAAIMPKIKSGRPRRDSL